MAPVSNGAWPELLALPPWVRLSEATVRARPLVDVLFKVEDGKYLLCVPYDAQIKPLENDYSIAAILWAETDGAAKRAVLQQLEADVRGNATPPSEILLPGGPVQYDEVVREAKSGAHGSLLESAIYRVGDGLFIDRTIALPRWTFHYRGRRSKGDEPCYAVEYRFPRSSALSAT